MNHRLPLLAPPAFHVPAARAQAATLVPNDTQPAKSPVVSVPAPAIHITHEPGVIPSRAILKFEVKQT